MTLTLDEALKEIQFLKEENVRLREAIKKKLEFSKTKPIKMPIPRRPIIIKDIFY